MKLTYSIRNGMFINVLHNIHVPVITTHFLGQFYDLNMQEC